jgi:predicted O-methyltransferase YrrM
VSCSSQRGKHKARAPVLRHNVQALSESTLVKYAVIPLPHESDVPANCSGNPAARFRHPAYAWLGLRPVLAQHTAAEHESVQKWAAGRSALVEIGVAEGVSALALRESMSEQGTLYLIDPYHLSRVPLFNFTKRAAHRAVESCRRGRVVWIEKFSQEAIKTWKEPIDLILIDGDHSENGVEQDWKDWSPFIRPGGVAVFHDARLFEGGWTTPDYGPVKLANRLFRDGRSPEWAIVEEIHSLLVVERRR